MTMSDIGFLSAFIVGLLGGAHCVGMCGGIVGALAVGLPDTRRRWPILLAYNGGRIASYTLAGALMGALGFFFSGLLPVQLAQRALLSLAGLFLVLMGLYLAGWSNLLVHVEQLGELLWRRIEPMGRGLIPVRSTGQGFALGLVWGWLPCGLVYSALVWTLASGSALEGAALMLAFGLGTLPNLLLMGVAAAQLNRWIRIGPVRVIAGSLIILFGAALLFDAWSI